VIGRGKHRASADNKRLRQLRREDRQYIRHCHERFAELGCKVRYWRARAEVAEGRLQAKEQQLQQQVQQLMARDTELETLRRQLKAASDDTVETQIPKLPKPELAGATT
jgi:chromosome segregation ATPase